MDSANLWKNALVGGWRELSKLTIRRRRRVGVIRCRLGICGEVLEGLTPEGVSYRVARLAAWELGSGARCIVPYGGGVGGKDGEKT